MSDEEFDQPLLSEEEFREALWRLNALCNPWWWQATTATKSHTDEFGVKIKAGENYYKRQYGPSFSSVLKLSRRSMDKMLFAVVHTCTTVEGLADLVREEEAAKSRTIRDRISK